MKLNDLFGEHPMLFVAIRVAKINERVDIPEQSYMITLTDGSSK